MAPTAIRYPVGGFTLASCGSAFAASSSWSRSIPITVAGEGCWPFLSQVQIGIARPSGSPLTVDDRARMQGNEYFRPFSLAALPPRPSLP